MTSDSLSPDPAANDSVRFLTTPAYYASGKAHAGHLYCSLLCQILKEHHISVGRSVLTQGGMDEHGEKIAQKAQASGVSPAEFVDAFAAQWKKVWKDCGIEFDIFIRTTSEEHKRNVQEIFQICFDKGDIYFGEHEGRYCVECEEFLNDKEMDSDGKCLIHKIPTEIRKEGNYYFRTTKYVNQVRDLIKSGNIIDNQRYISELLGMLDALRTDLSVSRPKTRTTWGIDLPFDKQHVSYVWFDALPNYVTARGGVTQAKSDPYWAHAYHLIGKDILRFHGIYWPAICLSIGIPVAKLIVTGWLLQSGSKMSKSLGNVITIETVNESLGRDAFVNTVFRLVNPGDDLEISESLIVERYNAELANGIGNLLSRTLTLANKAFGENWPLIDESLWTAFERDLAILAQKTGDSVKAALDQSRLADALRDISALVAAGDRYLTQTKPWELVGRPERAEDCARVLGASLCVIRVVGLLLYPFFPTKMGELLLSLGETVTERASFYRRAQQFVPQTRGMKLSAPPRLFPRKELKLEEAPQVQQPGPESVKLNKVTVTQTRGELVEFKDFAKVEIRVGLVEKAELVEGSDKLIRAEVQLGSLGIRQVFSGIRQWVKPEELAGRKVLVVANLQPRKMKFGVSEGMILSVEDAQGRVTPVIVSDDLDAGSLLA